MGTDAAPDGQHSTGGRSDAGRNGTHPPRLWCLRGRVDDLHASAGESLSRTIRPWLKIRRPGGMCV